MTAADKEDFIFKLREYTNSLPPEERKECEKYVYERINRVLEEGMKRIRRIKIK